MILIDTNVISEPWKPAPDPRVIAWIDAQAVETLYLSAVTVAELRFGVAAMPAGKRRTILQDRLEQDALPLFAGRILPFDLDASRAYAILMMRARAAGKAIGNADGYIAATAAAHGLTVATRDTSPFAAAGLNTVNPWEAAL
ncbi:MULTISPECIES: type II toxin-antitoxin system VapC family toxin [unclassified Mesorhizobium]|uniref:type II toxin-antitoxin system VapC family toxin n=1 Tax=unclassified Mesorhizobium TaxID=325217 RepID=UPI000FD4B7AB|nr:MULTISPECIES: type II toxin-antitoxin system VapC family toxin [unclassified Mesorhizobium]RUX06786.1 type II toxin-antitoxin system VapC family toxin [Mesorhizobium sp. M8A.F.Ca.ET.059.01.1.1]TGV13202.1 type II toxin-antitoxin system VapC family toxin [Mesorhizobium sp. M8A.F.Ca.ET.173.01.1.1]RWC67694.1 MAG: type II toxin-antitoxin system VapC family toxin [Mesorhizobium sp.]RWC86421.1 MAG: type II toxin-antitoxin system VapC family toxin [Mesorhizobium sp.]TGP88803.1 type II toxin-antitox